MSLSGRFVWDGKTGAEGLYFKDECQEEFCYNKRRFSFH